LHPLFRYKICVQTGLNADIINVENIKAKGGYHISPRDYFSHNRHHNIAIYRLANAAYILACSNENDPRLLSYYQAAEQTKNEASLRECIGDELE
jgi:hypothetical protein